MQLEFQGLARRIEHLERTGRRWRFAAMASFVALACLLTVAANERRPDGTFDYLEATSIVVRNDRGDAIVLTADETGASLLFSNVKQKRTAMSLDVTDGWPTVALSDTAGTQRFVWDVSETGAGLEQRDSRGKARLSMGASDWGSTFQQRDESGKSLLSLDADGDSAGIHLYEHGFFDAQTPAKRSASWTIIPGQAWLSFDLGKKEQAKIAVSESEAEFMARSPSGRYARMSVDAVPSELTFDGFVVSDGASGASVWSTIAADGPTFTVRDANGFSADLGVTSLESPTSGRKTTTSAASLVMFRKGGHVVWSAP